MSNRGGRSGSTGKKHSPKNKRAEVQEEIPTSTRTTGREIDLVLQQERSGARNVMGHATGMTVTVVGAVVNRSKHDMIWGFIPPPPQ